MPLPFRDVDRRIEIRSTREGLIRLHRMSETVPCLCKNFHRTGVVSTLPQDFRAPLHAGTARFRPLRALQAGGQT